MKFLFPTLVVIVSLVAVGLGYRVATSLPPAPPSQPSPVVRPTTTPKPSISPGPITVKGTTDCLPHKKTSGPQPLLCAMALRTDDGTYYALDFSQNELARQTGGGSVIQVTGTLTLPQETSPFVSTGTIVVTKITAVK